MCLLNYGKVFVFVVCVLCACDLLIVEIMVSRCRSSSSVCVLCVGGCFGVLLLCVVFVFVVCVLCACDLLIVEIMADDASDNSY